MNEIRTLMENFWISREDDKETFYKVKRDIPNFQRFIREQLGWKLIHTEKLLKLEKKPAHAEAFMGIAEFTDLRDYYILCVILMYLEDAEEGKQFLLSELIDYVETQLKNYVPVDWTSFSQRKSLVRVLQYMERLKMLRVYEGKSESFSQEAGQEVLYENTGYSKYFTCSFTTDISAFESWRDFEKTDFEEFQENRGAVRTNRVYRQLAVCPAFYWSKTDDADALYLKNQRQWIGRYMQENMGGHLDIYQNAAFFTLDTDDCYGNVHPRDAQISESVLLICANIQEQLKAGRLKLREDECIYMPRTEFLRIIFECRHKWKDAWSKEYCEMDDGRLVDTVLKYMKDWMLVRCDGEWIIVLPAVGRLTGSYPADYKGDGEA